MTDATTRRLYNLLVAMMCCFPQDNKINILLGDHIRATDSDKVKMLLGDPIAHKAQHETGMHVRSMKCFMQP